MGLSEGRRVVRFSVGERGGVGRAFRWLLVFCLLVGLASAVAYLMAERNRRQYRLRDQGGYVLIERGRLLPVGWEPYVPESNDLREAYKSAAIPEGEPSGLLEAFEDRSDMDRALFTRLAGWARKRLNASDGESFILAQGFVVRLGLLPGLSESQRAELKALQADLAYRNGRRLATEIAGELDQARSQFELAITLGTQKQSDAKAWAALMADQAKAYAEALGAQNAVPQQPLIPGAVPGAVPEAAPGAPPGQKTEETAPVPSTEQPKTAPADKPANK